MLAKKILKNLENGNYRIERREHCDCMFDWSIENGELVCDTDDYDCWTETVWLIMDDLAGQRDNTLGVFSSGIIASYDVSFGLTILLRKASVDVEQEIANAIKDSDTYKQLIADIYSPDVRNDLHDRRKRESLVRWLSKNDHLQTYVYYPRYTAINYVCVLLTLPYYYDYYVKIGSLQIPNNWYLKSAEEWAEMFLRKDTDDMQYDISFELVNEIYEIDYCWYDRRTGMTVSHDAERYFFVNLQDAEKFLDTLNPERADCYDLNKLTIDYSDGEIDDVDCQKTKWSPEIAKEVRK